ncbi:unnamed protein product [Closterium sp. NIES-53]
MAPHWPFLTVSGTAAAMTSAASHSAVAGATTTRATLGARLSAVHSGAWSWFPTNAARSRHSRTDIEAHVVSRRRSAVSFLVSLVLLASCVVVALTSLKATNPGNGGGIVSSFRIIRRNLQSSISYVTLSAKETTPTTVDHDYKFQGASRLAEEPSASADVPLTWLDSPYVRRHVIDMRSKASCKAIMPSPEISSDANLSSGPLAASLGHLANSTERVLLVIPRHGLGNSLRGFVSAFVFSRVSGRRLVLFHGGAHGKVLDALCAAFDCGLDEMRGLGAEEQQLLASPGNDESNASAGDGRSKGRLLGEAALRAVLKKLNFVDLQAQGRSLVLIHPPLLSPCSHLSLPTLLAVVRQSIPSATPLVLSRSAHNFDGFWQHYPAVRRCVAAAFNCQEGDAWCVHSHALQQLLPRPSPYLVSAMRAVVRRRRYTGGALLAAGGDEESDLSLQGVMFDIALHMRTRPLSIEGKGGGGASRGSSGEDGSAANNELAHVGCVDNDDTGENNGAPASATSAFLQRCLWSCLDSVIREVAEKQGKPIARLSTASNSSPRQPLSIFLATDSEELRGELVNRLSAYGDVYYSTGAVVHSSKTATNVAGTSGEGNSAAHSAAMPSRDEGPGDSTTITGSGGNNDDQGVRLGKLAWNLPTMGEFFLLSRAHAIIEAATRRMGRGLRGNPPPSFSPYTYRSHKPHAVATLPPLLPSPTTLLYFPSASFDSPVIVTPRRDLHTFFYTQAALPPMPLSSRSASTHAAHVESPASVAALMGTNAAPLRQPAVASPASSPAPPVSTSPAPPPVRGGAPASPSPPAPPASPASQGCDKQFSYTASTGCTGGNGAAVGYVFGGLLCILLLLFVSLTAICVYRRRYARYLSTSDPPLRSDLSGIQPMATTHSHRAPRKEEPVPLTPEPCPGVWVTLPGPADTSPSASGAQHPPLLQVAWPESYDCRLARAARANHHAAAPTAAGSSLGPTSSSAAAAAAAAAGSAGAAGSGSGASTGRAAFGAGQSLSFRRPSTGGSMRAGSHVPSPDSSIHSISSLEPSVHLSVKGSASFGGSGRGAMFGSGLYGSMGSGGVGVGGSGGGGGVGGVVAVGEGLFGVASGAMLPVRELGWGTDAVPGAAVHGMGVGEISAAGSAASGGVLAVEAGSGVGPEHAAASAALIGAAGLAVEAVQREGSGSGRHGSMREHPMSTAQLPVSLEESVSLIAPLPLPAHMQPAESCHGGSYGSGVGDGPWIGHGHGQGQGQGQAGGGVGQGEEHMDGLYGAGVEHGGRAEGRQHGGNIWQTISSLSISRHAAAHDS